MKVVLITGSSSGIGMATALHLAEKGYRCYASMRSLSSGEELLRAAEGKGVKLELIQLDVNDEASVKSAVSEILSREGKLDVLINNAGIAPFGPTEDLSDDVVRGLFETNVFGALRTIRAVLPSMRENRSGVIVNISSIAGHMSMGAMGIYAATKFALEGLSEALAQEVCPFGIRVAIVKPGFIVTPLLGKTADSLPPAEASAYPTAIGVMRALIESGYETGGSPEMCAETIEEAINDSSGRLRFPVGDGAKMILDGRARIADKDWVEMGRHTTVEGFLEEFAERFSPPA